MTQAAPQPNAEPTPELTPEPTRVLYNESCPVCRTEMHGYRRQAQRADLPIRFEDISQAACWGLTPDQAARRLYVLHQGQLLDGLPAMQALWRGLPGWRWLAWFTALPGVRGLTAFSYDRIAAPLLYRSHLRRQARLASKA